MARVTPVAGNGSTPTLEIPHHHSPMTIETRLGKLERQMDRALKMLEVISLNTTPVVRHGHGMNIPAGQNVTPNQLPTPNKSIQRLSHQSSEEISSNAALGNERHGHRLSSYVPSSPSVIPSLTPKQSSVTLDDIYTSIREGDAATSSTGALTPVTTPHRHMQTHATQGFTPTHSFFIPATDPNTQLSQKDATEDHHIGSKISNIVKDTSKKMKIAKLKMKRDLKVGMDKMSGKETVSSRRTVGHLHEAKHAILTSHPHMINPRAKFRLIWDMCLLMPLLLYLTFMMPFRICFANDPAIFSGPYWFEFMIEIVFVVDILLNFRTGYFIGGLGDEQMANNIEYHPLSVARHYLRTWFVLDLVSGIPFSALDLIIRMTGGDSGAAADIPLLKMVKSLRLLRFLKLIRLLKIEEMTSNAIMDRDTIDRIEDFFQEGSTRSGVILLSLAMQLGFICHIGACIWVYIGRRGAMMGEHTWFFYEPSGPYTEEDTTGEQGGGENVSSIYLAAFYYCLTTMTSVGYGDIIPRSDAERTYAICLEFIGGFVFAMIIASLTSVVTSSDMNARKVSEQLDSVSSFVQNRQFPNALGRRIRRHFRQFYSHKSAIDEKKIFGEMSSALRRDVSGYIVSVRMSDVKLFQSMNPKLWPRLFPLLNPSHFEVGECVCTQGEECGEMFIILEGSLSGQTLIDTMVIGPSDGKLETKQSYQHLITNYNNNNNNNNNKMTTSGNSFDSKLDSCDSHKKVQFVEDLSGSGGQGTTTAIHKIQEESEMSDSANETELTDMLGNSQKGEGNGQGISRNSEGSTDSGSPNQQTQKSPSMFRKLLDGSTSTSHTNQQQHGVSRGKSVRTDSGNTLQWFGNKTGGGGGSSGSNNSSSDKLTTSTANSTNTTSNTVGVNGKGGGGGGSKDFSAEAFVNGSWKNKSNSEKVKMRHIGPGDSVNVLCVVQVWNRCVETVIAETNVETYSVNADEFNTLFNHDSLVDQETFNQMRIQEVNNFRMDTSQVAPTIFGIPLYMTFSCVSCTVVAARSIMAADSNLLGANSSDPYATIELVDYDTGRTVNSQWFMRIATRRKTLNPQWSEKHTARWRDIHLPFESLALRVTLYDEDVMEDDDKLGEVYIRISDLDLEEEDCPFTRVPDDRLFSIPTEKAKQVIRTSIALTSQDSQLTSNDSLSERFDENESIIMAESEANIDESGSPSSSSPQQLPPIINTTTSPKLELETSEQRRLSEIMSSFKSTTSSIPDVIDPNKGSRRSFGVESVRTRKTHQQSAPSDVNTDNWGKVKVAAKFTRPMSPGRAWGGIFSALKSKTGAFHPDENALPTVSEEQEMMLEQLDAQVPSHIYQSISTNIFSIFFLFL